MQLSRLLIIFPISLVITSASKIDCPKPKSKRSIVSIDYETVRKEVIDASSISTQLINTIQWQTIQALGWSLGAVGYRSLLQMDLDEPTQKTIERMDFLFEPHNAAISLSRNLRNGFFALLGRIIFNLVTDPSGTYEEWGTLTYQSLYDEATDNDRLTLFAGRFAYQTMSLITGIAAIHFISNNDQATVSQSRNPIEWWTKP